jgi:hypothetical protein
MDEIPLDDQDDIGQSDFYNEVQAPMFNPSET